MNGTNSMTISDLRQNTARAIKNVVATQQPTIILQRSQPKAVLVDLAYYQALEEAVLDLTDSQEAERAKKEPRILFSTYLKKRYGTGKI